jgi:glucose-1-phosphate thymidylyltransferase
MKAVILAGGYARRMWPLTENQPKSLLPVADRPIIEHIIEKLEGLEEVEGIYISTNEKFEKHFSDWVKGLNTKKQVKLIIEPSACEEKKLGAVGGLKFLIEKEGIKDDLLVVGGDNLFESDLNRFLGFYRDKETPAVAFHDIGDVEKIRGKFGVCVLNEKGRIMEFQEKPQEPRSTLAATCIYLFPSQALDMVSEYLADRNNPDAPGFFINWLSQRQDVHGFVLPGRWFDIGSFEGLREADSHFRKPVKRQKPGSV